MTALYKTPPIKTQGIKTKLLPFIYQNLKWSGAGRWVEPFIGSGTVLFNLNPKRALVADTNKHIIDFYRLVQRGEITPASARTFLQYEGAKLSSDGESHYYVIRERFNTHHVLLDFLFLNRACFNGLMRFNKRGGFNTPFCRKVDRFSPAYITKICNQINWVQAAMKGKDWEFVCSDWSDILADVGHQDFVYADPPYAGRSTDYFNSWSESDAESVEASLKSLPCHFLYSMWLENRYRKNTRLSHQFNGYDIKTFEHYYHLGATESLRNSVVGALVCG